MFAVVLGVAVGFADAVLDRFFFYGGAFWEVAISRIPAHELYIRSLILITFTVFGVVMSRVLSRQHKAEQALRASERRYRNLFDQAPISLWKEDFSAVGQWLDGLRGAGVRDLHDHLRHHPEAVQHAAGLVRIVEMNQATLEMFQAASREEFLSALPTAFDTEEAAGFTTDVFAQELIAIWEGKNRFEAEFAASTLQGERIDCLLKWAVPTLRGVPNLSEMVVAISDITVRRRLEELAREREKELAHALRLSTVGQMASALAHELNQPLTAIASYLRSCVRLARSGPSHADRLVANIDKATAQAERAGEVIRRIRTFVRKDNAPRAAVDVNEIVREAVALVEHEVDRQRVRLRLELGNRLPRVRADRVEVEQVLVNLARNGLEAMAETEAAKRELVITTSQNGDDKVQVAVSDRGAGLPPAPTDQMFQPFLSSKPNGMGMGLAISRSIIEAHHGRLWPMPNPGQGATFAFTLAAGNGDDHDED